MDPQDVQRKRFLHGQRWTGLLLLLVGGVLLLRQTGYLMPAWLFTWPMLVILIGFMIGLRHGFRDFSWLILMLVGGVFLLDSVHPEYNMRKYAVPGIIIFLGLLFMISPKTKSFNRKWEKHQGCKSKWKRDCVDKYYRTNVAEPDLGQEPPLRSEPDAATATMDSTVDMVSVFSGIKKKILSKNFRGGEVICIFGGAELNLTNADFVSPITIEFVQIFGATKLIVPANWEVRSEVTAIFGGIEDKRPQPPNTISEKTLILNGTVLFGGVEVNSF